MKSIKGCDIVQNSMKRLLLFLSIFFILFTNRAFCENNRQLVDRVAAIVNGEAITQSEFDVVFRPIYEQIKQNYRGPNLERELETIRLKLLNQLIEDRLVYQEAQKLGITVSDAEVEEELQAFRSQFQSEDVFQKEMEASGVAMSEIERRIRERISISKLHQSVIHSKAMVSPAEAEQYYQAHPEEFVQKEEAELWSLTIRKGDEAIKKGIMDESAKKKAESLVKQLKQGANFEKLAKENSKDSRASQGGSMGFVRRGMMTSNIDKVVFSLPEGSLSDILETEEAYHIFKIGKKHKASKKTFEEVKDEVTEKLFRTKAHERFASWMEDLKKRSYISIR